MNIENTATSIKPSTESIALRPIGTVRSDITSAMLKARKDGLSLQQHMAEIKKHHKKLKTLVSELVLAPSFSALIEGIDEFSHILVLYWPHLVPSSGRTLEKVHPMGRKDIPAKGIFATCSPARPNPVLVTAVRLLERRDNTLRVIGFEAVDGSPILDIKPYNPLYYQVENPVVPEWMDRIQREIEVEE